jgi:hypothetical protein
MDLAQVSKDTITVTSPRKGPLRRDIHEALETQVEKWLSFGPATPDLRIPNHVIPPTLKLSTHALTFPTNPNLPVIPANRKSSTNEMKNLAAKMKFGKLGN